MRFVVLGAGAIGAYVGASLARGGSDVRLIARGAHLEAMQKHGVRVRSPRGDFTAHPVATDKLEAVSDADVVFVALKAYSLSELAPRLGALLGPRVATIWAQNGIPWWYFQSEPGPLGAMVLESVDPGATISRSIRPEHNVGCVVYCSAEIAEPGVIRHIEGTRFAIGEPDGSISARCREISEAFVAGGLKAPVETRLRDQIWLKLVGNVAFNPVSALTGATLGELGDLPEMVELLRQLIEENGDRCRATRHPISRFLGPASRRRPGHRQPQDFDVAGFRGRQAARVRMHDRRSRRTGKPTRHRGPPPSDHPCVHEAARSAKRGDALNALDDLSQRVSWPRESSHMACR